MPIGSLSWKYSQSLVAGDVFEEDGKTFEVLYVEMEKPGPIFGKPGHPNAQYIPRKVRIKQIA
jgi:hypothetical protein